MIHFQVGDVRYTDKGGENLRECTDIYIAAHFHTIQWHNCHEWVRPSFHTCMSGMVCSIAACGPGY